MKDLVHGLEHGEIQDLGSPILSKIQEAFLYIRKLASDSAHEEFSSYRSIEGSSKIQEETVRLAGYKRSTELIFFAGNHCGAIHVAWDKDEARLILFFKVSLDAYRLLERRQQHELLLLQPTPQSLDCVYKVHVILPCSFLISK